MEAGKPKSTNPQVEFNKDDQGKSDDGMDTGQPPAHAHLAER